MLSRMTGRIVIAVAVVLLLCGVSHAGEQPVPGTVAVPAEPKSADQAQALQPPQEAKPSEPAPQVQPAAVAPEVVVPVATPAADAPATPDAAKKPPKKKKINVTTPDPQSETKTLPGSGRHGIEILAGYGFAPSFNAGVGGFDVLGNGDRELLDRRGGRTGKPCDCAGLLERAMLRQKVVFRGVGSRRRLRGSSLAEKAELVVEVFTDFVVECERVHHAVGEAVGSDRVNEAHRERGVLVGFEHRTNVIVDSGVATGLRGWRVGPERQGCEQAEGLVFDVGRDLPFRPLVRDVLILRVFDGTEGGVIERDLNLLVEDERGLLFPLGRRGIGASAGFLGVPYGDAATDVFCWHIGQLEVEVDLARIAATCFSASS